MKEPPTASRALRKKPSATAVAARKLKLFCSFNGAFHLRPPYNKLRYIGGDTRVVTVDRNVTFSKLLMKISDLCPSLKSFSLKYKLLDSNYDWDPPLVSIESDDDVKCMIEDFDKLELYGTHARLWLFVCSHSCDTGDKNKSSLPVNNCNGRGNNGIRCSLGFGNNGVGENRQRCGYDLPLIDLTTELSDPFLMDVRDQCFERSALEHSKGNGKLNSGESFGNFVNHAVAPRAHPLNPRDGNLLPERNGLMHCLPGQNSGNYNDLCNSHVASMCNGVNGKQEVCNNGQPSMNNLNRENIFPWGMSNPWSYSNKINGCIYPVKTTSACQRVSGGNQNCIRHHRFGLNEVRNHHIHPYQIRSRKNMVELGKGNHRALRLDARLSAGRYSGLRPNSSIAKLVQPMRLYVSSHSKPDFPDNITEKRPSAVKLGLHDASGLTVEQTSYCVSQSGNSNSTEYHLGYHAGNPVANQSLVCGNVSGSVALPVGAIETQHDHLTGSHSLMHEIPCQSASQGCCRVPMNTKPLMFVQKKKNGISDFLDNLCPSIETTQECNENLISRREGYNDTRCSNNDGNNLHGGVASSVDLMYNLSLSSSKEVETPGLSSLASNGASNTLLKSQIKPSNLINKAKVRTSPKSEKPAAVTSDPLSQCGPDMEKNCMAEEEIQQDPPSGLVIDEQAATKDSIKGSKVIGGISNDLAAFYTHLATKELQAIKFSDLEFIKELGSGTYGTVYHGKWKGSDVAIKKLKPSCFTDGSLEEDRLVTDFWKEAHMLGQLHHPNIVAFYGVVRDGPANDLATVTEYMVNGSLKQVLRRKDRTIDRRKRLIIAMDAAFGMEYLHEKNIVHFDLKSHNLLVNMKDPQRPTCKIGDLGLSKIKQRTLVSGGVRGTIPWMAPEILNSKNNMVTEKVDVYSFGVVMWELLTGEEPYANLRSEEIIAGIIKGTLRPEIPSWCDPAWRSLMVRCWSSDPNDRPAFSEIAKELRTMSAAMNIK